MRPAEKMASRLRKVCAFLFEGTNILSTKSGPGKCSWSLPTVLQEWLRSQSESLPNSSEMFVFKIAQKKPFSFEKGLYFILLRRLRFWAQFFLLSARIFLDGCAYSKVLRGGLYPFSQIRSFRD